MVMVPSYTKNPSSSSQLTWDKSIVAFYWKVVKQMAKTTVKTGQIAPISGQYRPVGSSTEVTFVQGKRIPPTANGATKFTLVDSTKHKGKR